MVPFISAIILYFLIVFGVGFCVGPVRVLLLEPLIGPVAAVSMEMPVLLAAMFLAAKWVPKQVGMIGSPRSYVLMGVGALVLQQVADFAVGITIRGMTASQIFATYMTVQGAIYGLSLIAFAAMPWIVHRTQLFGGRFAS
jgi:hypothetical protein